MMELKGRTNYTNKALMKIDEIFPIPMEIQKVPGWISRQNVYVNI